MVDYRTDVDEVNYDQLSLKIAPGLQLFVWFTGKFLRLIG